MKSPPSPCPVFPLPKVVLFPGAILPLHVFEPRYRKLAADCIEGSLPVVMASILQENDRPQEAPTLRSLATVGDIIYHKIFPDGRYLLVLRGRCRVRLRAEVDREGTVSGSNYRMFELEPEADIVRDAAQIAAADIALRGVARALAKAAPEIADPILSVLGQAESASQLSDTLAAMIFEDDDDRMALLESLDVADRLDAVSTKLSELLVHASEPAALN